MKWKLNPKKQGWLDVIESCYVVRVFFFCRHSPRFDYWPSGLLSYSFMGYVVEVQEEKHLEFKYT